jgi:hypothetical protein
MTPEEPLRFRQGKLGSGKGCCWLLLFAVIAAPFLWQYHKDALQGARATGRGDTWAKLCEDYPQFAARNAPGGCQSYEHHFRDNP